MKCKLKPELCFRVDATQWPRSCLDAVMRPWWFCVGFTCRNAIQCHTGRGRYVFFVKTDRPTETLVTYIVVSLSLFVYSVLIYYSNILFYCNIILITIIVYCLFIRFSDTGVPVPHIFPLNSALFHGQPEVLRDLLPRVDGHLIVLVVSCRHVVQVRVLANFLRQTLFQVVHSPKLKRLEDF